MLDIKYIKRVYIQSAAADPAPPLGTILGNIGVNTTNFCNQFNLFSNKLVYYFKLNVLILIYSNNTFRFEVSLPTTSHFLNLLKFSKTIKIKVFDRLNDKIISCIKIYDLCKLAKLKFPDLPLQQSLLIVNGTVKSMGLIVVKA